MPEDKLINPPAVSGGEVQAAEQPSESPARRGTSELEYPNSGGYAERPYEAYYPPMEGDEPGVDIRRYFTALLRYKWLLVAASLVGLGGAYLVWTKTTVLYRAEGTLIVEQDTRRSTTGDVSPIRASSLLESNQWIELIRSYQVLDSVAMRERLFIEAPAEFDPAFELFEVDSAGYRSGDFELAVGESGDDYVLTTSEGQLVQQGSFGVPIGENVGFVWNPSRGTFEAGTVVPFSVLTPRDAAIRIDSQLGTSMDLAGTFLTVTMTGPDPARVAAIVNAVMARHIEVAHDLKTIRLRETLTILREQLQIVSDSLVQAENDLESFRIATISQPTDQTMPIAPGLDITRDPVFGNYFDMRVQVEGVRRDRLRLEAVASRFGSGEVRIEALEMIPTAAESTELRQILGELVDARSDLRALQNRYTDDYGPIQDKMAQIASIEGEHIPNVVNGLLGALSNREAEMNSYVSEAAAELREIPPRTIEEGRLERRVLSTTNLYNDLRGRVEAAQLAARSSIPDVRPLDLATEPQRPSQDNRLPLAAAVFFGCLGLAVGGAILMDRLDARYRYAADVSRDIGLDILGSIPRIEAARGQRGVINAAQALEAFRELRIHVGFAYGSAGPITLAITSPSEGEGKSLCSSNLAVAFSEVGRRTLLIDGDTRRGDAHRLLGCDRSPGLIDYLRERNGADIIQATDHPNLDFIGSGSRGVSTPELLASPRMAYFIGTLKRTYDVIIVDCPPLASGGDPLILGSLTGNLAVVIRTGSTEKALAQAKLDQLSRLPVRILGAILNDVSASDSYHSYYASYLPSYEPVPEGDDVVSTPLLGDSPAEETS